MSGLFITEKEAADLLNVSIQSINKSICKYEVTYTPGHGRGGRQLRIALDSLPEAAQAEYYMKNGLAVPPELEGKELDGTELLDRFSLIQVRDAEFRAVVVRKFWRSGLRVKQFLEKYNSENSERVTDHQLRDWEKRYKANGRALESLIDKRGGKRGEDSIPPEVWEYFLSCILTPQKRSVSLCYDLTVKKFPAYKLPTVRTFQIWYKEKIPEYAKLKAAGRKDSYEVSLNSVKRDYRSEHSNSIWVLDHHLSDVFVRNKQGKITRLWLTAAMDVSSRKIMSIVAKCGAPDASRIKQGLRIAMMRFGIPETLQTDNGKDYISKSVDDMLNAFELKGFPIERITALPYHGQSKPIERFFKTLEERFGKRFYSYAGNNAKDRPDYLQKTNRELAKDPNIPTITEFIEKLGAWIAEYNAAPHSGQGMDGKTPDQVYSERMPAEIRQISDEALTWICGERAERKVVRNEIQLMNRNYRNRDGKLANYNGKTVKIAFIPENIDVLFILDEQERFICKCSAVQLSPYHSANLEGYRENQHIRKTAKKIIREQMPKTNISLLDTLGSVSLEEQGYGMPKVDIEALGESMEQAEPPEREVDKFYVKDGPNVFEFIG